MPPDTTAHLAQAAMTWAVLYAAHLLGDHAGQSSRHARDKHLPGPAGRRACAAHVATLTLAQLVGLALLAMATAAAFHPAAVAAGLAVNAWTHYWFDRRFTARGLYAALGKTEFADLGTPRPGRDDNTCLGTGAYRMDQDWHTAWLVPAALIVAAPGLGHAAVLTAACAAVMAAAITASRRQRAREVSDARRSAAV